MRKNINEAISQAIRLMAILVVVLFGAVSCTDEHFIGGIETEEPETPVYGDTIVSFGSNFQLHHGDWEFGDTLAVADHYYSGSIEHKVNDVVVMTTKIDHENAPMRISWEPIAETPASSAEKMYIGSTAGDTVCVGSHTNQKVNFKKYERECKLSFVGMEVTLTGEWYEASLGADTISCRYDSTSVATQVSDTVKVDGEKIEVELNGMKYNRVNVIAKAMNHFTDLPSKKAHSEEMDIQYSVLVPVNFVPGEKFYEGSIAGSGSYTKVSEESYESTLELTHIFTQDGKQVTEQETVSGIAVVRTWVEEAGPKMVIPTIEIGNPTVSVSENSSNLYKKEGYIYAKKYTTVWSYTWENGFTKKVYSEVERLYYMREEGKEVAMPYGETSTSFKLFEEGTPSEKSENGKLYNAYDGYIEFAGVHSSKAYELVDEFFLNTTQEFWVEKEIKDEFRGYDKKIVEGNNNQDAQIIITEHWSISGDKEVVFTQSANYSFSVSEQQRVFGEALLFVSGLEKSTDATGFNEVKENQYVSTVTDTYTAKFNPDCEVKAIAGYIKAYIEYRGERINFEFAEATVSYEGINNPTATEVTVDGKLFSRLAYEVSFAHSVLGTKNASVLVDEEKNQDPTTPDEWGKLDLEKTLAYGGLSWSWRNEGGIAVPFVTLTVVTEHGIVSAWEGGECFTEVDTNTMNGRLSNSIYAEGSNYLIPAYISIPTNPNKHWVYTDINGKKRDSVAGSDIMLLADVTIDEPFIADGGEVVTNASYEINGKHVKVTYLGKVLFEHTFTDVVKVK